MRAKKKPPLAVRQHPGAFWDLRFWIYDLSVFVLRTTSRQANFDVFSFYTALPPGGETTEKKYTTPGEPGVVTLAVSPQYLHGQINDTENTFDNLEDYHDSCGFWFLGYHGMKPPETASCRLWRHKYFML